MYMYYLVGYKLMLEEESFEPKEEFKEDRPIFDLLNDKLKKKVSSADEILKVYICYWIAILELLPEHRFIRLHNLGACILPVFCKVIQAVGYKPIIMTNLYSLKVPELKQYLHERGVICRLGRKLDLIKIPCDVSFGHTLSDVANSTTLTYFLDTFSALGRERTWCLSKNHIFPFSVCLHENPQHHNRTCFKTHSLITHLLDAYLLHRKYRRIRKYPNHVIESKCVNSGTKHLSSVIRKSAIAK